MHNIFTYSQYIHIFTIYAHIHNIYSKIHNMFIHICTIYPHIHNCVSLLIYIRLFDRHIWCISGRLYIGDTCYECVDMLCVSFDLHQKRYTICVCQIDVCKSKETHNISTHSQHIHNMLGILLAILQALTVFLLKQHPRIHDKRALHAY